MTTQSKAIPTVTPSETSSEFQTGQVLTIVGGHFVHDTFSAFLSPLLPRIIESLSLSLTQAGALWGFSQYPMLLTPFIGHLADRLSLRYFVILAPAVTATLMSLLGVVPNYLTLAILLFVSGISVAAFHAPAPSMVARLSGERLGKGMSWFMAGGELGRTVGPLLAVGTVSLWALDGYYRIMVIGWAASLILYWRLREIPARSEQRQNFWVVLPTVRRLFLPLLGVMAPREFVLTAFSFYLPTFMALEGRSLWAGGMFLAVWELAGIGGALTGGTLSDKVGRNVILLVTISLSSLLMLLFLQTSGWLLVPVLLAHGFASLSGSPVMLAMVQEHLPRNRAMASGLFISIGFLLRSLVAFAIGYMGDRYGLPSAFFWSAIISLGAIPLILFLPQVEKQDSP